MTEKFYAAAGDVEQELEDISLKSINGGADVETRGLSQGNDGDYCTITWECGMCPTHTCWC
ncbi:plantaricin C family lantibiotic [Salibacterium aidingense]|uniref:plantaricin C family lantibiotic n=1 Tax=Salibacterium aidingense TaxID=384933 RepID=UPI00047E047B|nr:plantaricin C family lantibiotic [Salibacterium aidingense]